MIINVYLPEQDAEIIDKLKILSDQKRRSFSFIVREALEYYLHSNPVKSSSKKKEE